MKRGGAINRFPSVGKEIPAPPNVTPERYAKVLETRTNIYSITGHGQLLPSQIPNVFMVPENTWILFLARAGSNLKKIRDDESILNDFRYLREGESVEQWYSRINQSMQEGTLLKDVLYSKQSPDKSGVYEPGDLVFDMAISIRNTSPPWGPIGIWKLPLKRDHLNKLNELRSSHNSDVGIFINKVLSNPEVLKYIQEWKNKFPNKADILEKSIIAMFSGESDELMKYGNELSSNGQMALIMMLESIKKVIDINKNMDFIGKNKDDVFLNWGSTNGIDLNLYTQTNESKNFKNKSNTILLSSILENNAIFPFSIPHPNFAFGKPVPPGKERIPMYRIFVIESCRPSAEDIPQTNRLVRTMSNATREDFEVCPIPRKLTNKKTLQENASEYPIIRNLIEGRSEKFDDIQPVLEKIKGSPLLEHQFNPDDIITIQGFSNISSQGALNNTKAIVLRKEGNEYIVMSENTGDEIRLSASNMKKGGRRHKTYRKKKLRRQTRKYT